MARFFPASIFAAFTAISGCTPTEITAPVARVTGNQVHLLDGSVFVARGINLQYGDAPAERQAAIEPIAATGANIVRLQLLDDTSAAQLERALETAIARGLLVMPFYGGDGRDDGTGPACSNDPNALQRATEKWARDWRRVLQQPQYQPYLLLNVANQWGRKLESDTAPEPMTYDDFIDHYRRAIRRLRKAGYQMPLVIDAPHCGQDFEAFSSGRGRELLESDPLDNVVMSVHAYWRYRNPNEIDTALQALEAEGVPYLFGEFGNSQYHSTMGGNHATDANYLLKRLAELNRGWIAWSWYGNEEFELKTSLDLSTAMERIELTAHGELVVNGPYGIKATATPVPPQPSTTK